MPLTVSHRCRQISPSLTLAVDAQAKALRAQGLDVVGFGAGEPDFPTPPHICDAAKYAIDHGMTRYTASSGTVELRQAICDKLLRDNELSYEPADIIVSNGAKHSLFNICQAILDLGDEVLIPTPCWVSYGEMVRMAGGVPVFVPASEEEGFVPSIDAFQERVTRRTKAVIITSPSNPCGCVWRRKQLQDLAELCVEKGLFVISDEIYEKLLYDCEKHLSIAQISPEIKAQTFVCNGVSKAFAMTGWRIGYTAGPREIIQAMGSFQSQATSNPNAIAQYAATVALNSDQSCICRMVEEFERRRDLLVRLVNNIPGLSCLKPRGAFYVLMNIKGILGRHHGDEWITNSMIFSESLLRKKLVAVVPGIAFEAEGYVRLSYAISQEDIQKGLSRIAEYVAEMY